MNDFNKKFTYKRFSTNVMVIREDFQNGVFDSTIITSKKLKKNVWSKINSVMGSCDYIASKDSIYINSFFIWSNKAYQKFWVRYDTKDKIVVIKIIKPKVSVHLIPAPCGN